MNAGLHTPRDPLNPEEFAWDDDPTNDHAWCDASEVRRLWSAYVSLKKEVEKKDQKIKDLRDDLEYRTNSFRRGL